MNLIDEKPMRPGWGRVWQGGELSSLLNNAPAPHVMFSLVGGIGFSPQVSVYMGDDNTEVLPDEMLLSMVQSAGAFLSRGRNLLIHCFEGKYRSTYFDVAVHMAFLKIPMEQAFGRVKTAHPIADLREGTRAQLKRLEIELFDIRGV